ncbi:MAG: DUF2442 domain-containing protein [Ignavibacteriae bacterium]|nr:DUF2442 domain-containing protein [Ignavibacteriota bacterium]
MVNRNKFHQVNKVRFVNDEMKIEIDGREYSYFLKNISQVLYKAPQILREKYEVDPYGYGIHWPLLDEDLSIDGLLGIKHYPPTITIKQHA